MTGSCHIDVPRADGSGVRQLWLSPKRIEQARERLAQGPVSNADLAALLGLCAANAKRVAVLAGASCVRGDRHRPLYHYLPGHEVQARHLAGEALRQEPNAQRDELLRAYLAIGPLSVPMIERVLGVDAREAYRVGLRVADVVHFPDNQGAGWTVYADRALGAEGAWFVQRDLASLRDPAARRVQIIEALASGVCRWGDLVELAQGQQASLSRHLQTLLSMGAVGVEPRPPGTPVNVSRVWYITPEGRRILAAHHEEVLVGLRPGVIPGDLAAHPRVTAWGHLWDRILFAMRGAPSPAELAVTLGLHPVMADRLWDLALPHLQPRTQAACLVAKICATPLSSGATSLLSEFTQDQARQPASPTNTKHKNPSTKTTNTKEPSHDRPASPLQLLPDPYQPSPAPAPASEPDGDPDSALADVPSLLGGEAAGGPALGDRQPAAPEAGEPGAPSDPRREPARPDPDPRDLPVPPSRGRGDAWEGRGGPAPRDRGASPPGPRPAELVTPHTRTPTPHPVDRPAPERHIALQPPMPTNPNADVMRRLALARRAQAERAAVVLEAGGLPWTLRPVPAVTGAWEIVESALDADKRLFGEEIARARLRRLAAQGCLPARTDGLRPTTQPPQEATP